MRIVFKIFGRIFFFTLILMTAFLLYYAGFTRGIKFAESQSEGSIEDIIGEKIGTTATLEKGETKVIYVTPKPAPPNPKWGGPDLWETLNKRRTEYGVNPLGKRDELCTIASIRLNQILTLGTLDGHEGFGKLPGTRDDLKWIFEKYNISEFLVAGATSPSEAVSLWDNTLSHKILLSGGEYVWGCVYAQDGFGVAIAAY